MEINLIQIKACDGKQSISSLSHRCRGLAVTTRSNEEQRTVTVIVIKILNSDIFLCAPA